MGNKIGKLVEKLEKLIVVNVKGEKDEILQQKFNKLIDKLRMLHTIDPNHFEKLSKILKSAANGNSNSMQLGKQLIKRIENDLNHPTTDNLERNG